MDIGVDKRWLILAALRITSLEIFQLYDLFKDIEHYRKLRLKLLFCMGEGWKHSTP